MTQKEFEERTGLKLSADGLYGSRRVLHEYRP